MTRPQTIQEQDLDYCSKCDAIMRFNKCSNGCHDKVKTQQYQILKTYKSLKSAFRNWKRNTGEKVGEIEEYRGFILESEGEPNETELFLLDFKLNGFISYGSLATIEDARLRVDNWIKEQSKELLASEVDESYKKELLEKLAEAKKEYREQLEQIHKQIKEFLER